jgi:hypothetical protein
MMSRWFSLVPLWIWWILALRRRASRLVLTVTR